MSNEPPQGTDFVRATLSVLGGKWKILILWHLKDAPLRFNALRRSIPEISEKVLIQQLRELEKDKVVSRTVFSRVPPHVEYAFSNYGRSLKPVLDVLCNWGEEHLKRNAQKED